MYSLFFILLSSNMPKQSSVQTMRRILSLISALFAENIIANLRILPYTDGMKRIYLWQLDGWPHFTWKDSVITPQLIQVLHKQAELYGAMRALGFSVKSLNHVDSLTQEIAKSAAIEGERIPAEDLRSSIARHLGAENVLTQDAIERLENNQIPQRIQTTVRAVLDAIQHCKEPLTKERLCSWHSLLFPQGFSAGFKITTGSYRRDEYGPMRVISGNMGKERIHFEAPPASSLESEMNRFFHWFNRSAKDSGIELTLKSAISHLYFVTIHPFDDGNGRLSRILADMILSQDGNDRLFSMSAQLLIERKDYYAMLEKTQSGSTDITEWLDWYLGCMARAIESSLCQIERTQSIRRFWEEAHRRTILNERQKNMLSRVLDSSWQGNLTTSKWAKICKCSQDTATRDIKALTSRGILKKEEAGGRSTSYSVCEF